MSNVQQPMDSVGWVVVDDPGRLGGHGGRNRGTGGDRLELGGVETGINLYGGGAT